MVGALAVLGDLPAAFGFPLFQLTQLNKWTFFFLFHSYRETVMYLKETLVSKEYCTGFVDLHYAKFNSQTIKAMSFC